MTSKKCKDSVSAKFISRANNRPNIPLFGSLSQARQENINAVKSKSLFIMNRINIKKSSLVTYDIDSQIEEVKNLSLPKILFSVPAFIQLPNELLFFYWNRKDSFSSSSSDSDSEDAISNSDSKIIIQLPNKPLVFYWNTKYSFSSSSSDSDSEDAISNSDSEDARNYSRNEQAYNELYFDDSSSDSDSKEFNNDLECKNFNQNLFESFVSLPFKQTSAKKISAVYFSRSVYCFYEKNFYRYDLDRKKWKRFVPVPFRCANFHSSVIFNRKILISGEIPEVLTYSPDIESYSIIPYKFRSNMKKILISTKKRLYLIGCKNGSIYESEAGNEYSWKIIGNSIIEEKYPDQIFCAYHKGDFYISLYYENNNYRGYYKFDLNRKALIEISYHYNYSVIRKIGENIKAIECWDQKIKDHSDDAIAYFKQKHSLYYLNCYWEATASCIIYDKVHGISFDRKSHSLYNHYKLNSIGNAYNILGFNLKAIEFLNEAIDRKPDYAEAYNNKGVALGDLDRNLEAIKCYDKAIKYKPNYADAYYNKGNALKHLKRFSEAIKFYSEAIKLNGNYFSAYLNKGNILARLGNDLKAIECYSKAINLKPDKVRRFFSQGGSFDQWRWNQETIKCYMGQGNALYKLDRYNEAIGCYSKAIKLAHDNADAYNNIGNAFSNLEKHFEAIRCYNRAIKLIPDEPQFLLNRARVFEKLGRQEEALQDFNTADDLMQKFNQNNN